MKKITIVLILAGVIFVGKPFVFAQNNKPIPPVMYQFMAALIELSPYLDQKEEFSKASNEKQIQDSLKKMKEYSKQLKNHKRLTTPGYQMSADHFVSQLHQVDRAFSGDHKNYAWRLFRSTMDACSHCHAQEKDQSPTAWNFSTFDLPKDPMAKANFLYLVRAFEQSWDLYDEVIQGFPLMHKNEAHLDLALDHMLTIGLRAWRSPEIISTYLKSLKNKSSFPTHIQNRIQDWDTELALIDDKTGNKILSEDVTKFESYIDDHFRLAYPFPKFGRSERVVMEYGSGLLFEWINTKPEHITQRMHFWLGVSNIALDHRESTTMGEYFLQQCIENYEVSSISNLCFDALEEQWIIGFSGSAGVFLPRELDRKLKTYRKKLGIAASIQPGL